MTSLQARLYGNDVMGVSILIESARQAVEGGSRLVPSIKELVDRVAFDMVLFTRDWHPSNHCSFAENHLNKKPLEHYTVRASNQFGAWLTMQPAWGEGADPLAYALCAGD
jgi:nicotinamidase-related amidase